MKQVIFKNGSAELIDTPSPTVSSNSVIIQVVSSCISAGTELSTILSTGDGLIKRAISQPENIIKTINFVKDEGFLKTIELLKSKKDIVESSGYSISGVVVATGKDVTNFTIGDKVAAAGDNAVHSQFVEIPTNLVVKVPDNLDFNLASTVAIGSIALQAVRRSKINLGEFVAVYGVGLIGQIITKLLTLNGARVFAIDINENNLNLARCMGAEKVFNPKDINMSSMIIGLSNNKGVDKAIFAANTTNNDSLSNAFKIIRKKGQLIMLGQWGDRLNRADIYKKEIDFLISTSYGPGRYDPEYEEDNLDYPYHLVRWTENRNMKEYLRLLHSKSMLDQISIKSYDLEKVENAFSSLKISKEATITILDYGFDENEDFKNFYKKMPQIQPSLSSKNVIHKNKIKVGVIGAGQFAQQVHLPNLLKLKDQFEILSICNKSALSSKSIAEKFSAKYSTTNNEEIINDPNIDLVMICTRHYLHGSIVLKSLEAGKNVFVEKPLCTNIDELKKIKQFFLNNNKAPLLMVGFNRRYSPYALEINKHLKERVNPLIINYQMNAGRLPDDHWVYEKKNGGRIIGEACHIIDLFSYFVDSRISQINTSFLGERKNILLSENVCISITYNDGSIGLLNYFTDGAKELSKERFEIHFDGKSILVDDYKSIKSFGFDIKNISSIKSSKGLLEELEQIAELLKGNGMPINLNSIFETTEASLLI